MDNKYHCPEGGGGEYTGGFEFRKKKSDPWILYRKPAHKGVQLDTFFTCTETINF